MRLKRTGLILLGGMAVRADYRPKYLFEYDGEPFLTRQIRVLREVTDEIILSCRDMLQVQDLSSYANYQMVTDTRIGKGPSEGIRAGAQAASGDLIFIVACDMPLLIPSVIQYLFDSIEGAEAAIPGWSDGTIEPLHAVYQRKALLRYFSGETPLRLRSIADQLHTVIVPMQSIRAIDPDLRSFTNINDHEALVSLQKKG